MPGALPKKLPFQEGSNSFYGTEWGYPECKEGSSGKDDFYGTGFDGVCKISSQHQRWKIFGVAGIWDIFISFHPALHVTFSDYGSLARSPERGKRRGGGWQKTAKG